MSRTLIIDHKKMHSVKSAAGVAGYSRDHITKLARDGKIIGTQVGRNWYVDLDSLKSYAAIANLELEVKKKHTSEVRKATKELREQLDGAAALRSTESARLPKRTQAAVVALGFVCLVSAAGASELLVPYMKQAPAAAVQSDANPAPVTTTHRAPSLVNTTFASDAAEVSPLVNPDGAIVLLPLRDADGTVSSSTVFSDEVVIEEGAKGERRVVPIDEAGNQLSEGVPFSVLSVEEIPVP